MKSMMFPSWLVPFIVFMASCQPSTTQNNHQTDVEEDVTTINELFHARVINKSADEALTGLASLIHPDMGAFLLLREGNTDVLKLVKSPKEFIERMHNRKEMFNQLTCKIETTDELPEFNEAGDFNKKGCYASPISSGSFSLLTDKIRFLQKELDVQFTEEEINNATNIDKSITDVIVLTDAFAELLFAKKENNWYLVCINLSKYDTSL